jgi:trimethylamine--corrinoid protein Co-methyltransferase
MPTDTPQEQTSGGSVRRRERSRGFPAKPPVQIPRLEVPWPPLEIFSASEIERMLDAVYRVLEEIGMEILNPAALERFALHGAQVDAETGLVRIGRDIVQHFCSLAPERFVLHARNPVRDLHVGGNVVNFGPVNGAPNVSDLERGRRYGDIEAFRDILKVTHGLGIVHWQGGVVVEPVDLPVHTRHLDMYREHIVLSDAVWAARGVGGVQAFDGLNLCALEHGISLDDLARRPSLMIVTNVNSPRRVDAEILDSIMLMAEHGQCVVITPFTLMGAMAPITLPGALVQQTAEALAIVALVQMIRSGTPVVLGGFTSNVDMRTGSPAFGTPEYVRATIGGAQLARRLRLPYRSSSVNAAPCVDAQAAYETGFSLFAAIMSHSHLINHAAGWLEGGLCASMEKIVVDAEMLRHWAEILKQAEMTDDDIGLEAIRSVPAGGHYFGCDHTKARYQTAFYRPILSDWSNYENWRDAGELTATQRALGLWKSARDAYVAPPLDPAIRDSIEAYVARRKQALGDV